MSTTLLSHTLRSICLVVTGALTLTTSTGCAMLSNWCNAILVHAETTCDMAEIRRDTRAELADQEQEARRQAAEREVEQARIAGERAQLEREFCLANQEAQQEALRRNVKDTLQSKVAFNVEQGLEVGELEVDVQELQALLKERDKPQAPVQAPLKHPCKCCDQACNCGSGFIRRLCPHCRHKCCEAEKDCGGPAALARLEQQPLKQPLRPAEIPLKLPVRLTFGIQQPEMEAARIRKQPVTSAPFNQPCDRCTQPCTNPAVGPRCTDGVSQYPSDYRHATRKEPPVYQQLGQPSVPTVEPDVAPTPTPEPEVEARRIPPISDEMSRLGMAHSSAHEFAWQPQTLIGPSWPELR